MTRAIRYLVLLASAVVVIVQPAGAVAKTRTTVTIFRAFTASGTPTIPTRSESGHCYTGALTVDRNDAWRCIVGNYLHAPCFSAPQAAGVVVCPDAQVNRGLKIRLTKGLPRRYANTGRPSLSNQPWALQLTNGQHCTFASGATNVIHGIRGNYTCGAGFNFGLWGFPSRRSEPWTILIAPFTATRLHRRTAIRHAWM